MHEILFKKYILQEDYQNAFKLNLFFLSNPSPFNGQNYGKKGSGTSEQLFLRLRKSSKTFPCLLYMISPS